METTLTKSSTDLLQIKKFKLEPFGRFNIKWIRHPERCAPRTIPFIELEIDYDSSYPMSDKQEQEIVDYMKANKTDILTDGDGFYTRLNQGLVVVKHPKLIQYREDNGFKAVIDNE